MIVLWLPFEWDTLVDHLERFTYRFYTRDVLEEFALYWLTRQFEEKLTGLRLVSKEPDFNLELKSFLDNNDAAELRHLAGLLDRWQGAIRLPFHGHWASLKMKGQRTVIIKFHQNVNNTFTGSCSNGL